MKAIACNPTLMDKTFTVNVKADHSDPRNLTVACGRPLSSAVEFVHNILPVPTIQATHSVACPGVVKPPPAGEPPLHGGIDAPRAWSWAALFRRMGINIGRITPPNELFTKIFEGCVKGKGGGGGNQMRSIRLNSIPTSAQRPRSQQRLPNAIAGVAFAGVG